MTHRDVENAITNFDIKRSISVIRRADADRYTINKIATVKNDLSIHRRELRLLVAEGAIYKVSITPITMYIKAVYITLAQSCFADIVATKHTPGCIGLEGPLGAVL